MPSLCQGLAIQLVGRHGGCDVLVRILEAVRARESRALVVRGDPGVDKTALLGNFWSEVPIAASGIFGAMAVIAVNLWMDQPGGYTQTNSRITSANVWQRRDACVPRVPQGGYPQALPRYCGRRRLITSGFVSLLD